MAKRKEGVVSMDTLGELRNKLDEMAAATGKHRNVLLAEMIANYNNSPAVEITPKVAEAIERGASIEKLTADGREWAAARYLGQSDRDGAIDLSAMTDEEIESIDIKQAKQLNGLAEEKIRRTISRLQRWNEAHPQQPIDITASFVVDLRDFLKRMTDGRITGISRNVAFSYCKEIELKGQFPRGHNASIGAESLAVKAFRDLLDGKIKPSYESAYREMLES